MKKLLIAAAMLIASTGIFAQAQPKKDAKDASKMTAVKKDTTKSQSGTYGQNRHSCWSYQKRWHCRHAVQSK